jgi:hypothetical protein
MANRTMKFLLYLLIGTSLSCGGQKPAAVKSKGVTVTNNSQSTPGIKNSYAYSQVRTAGTIAVDENGNQLTKGVDTFYTVYIETPDNITPEIQTVWLNNEAHSVSVVPIEEKTVSVTSQTPTGKAITINTAPGNRLWMLEVGEPIPNKALRQTTPGTATLINSMLIEGTINNKKFSQAIDKVVQLPRVNGL